MSIWFLMSVIGFIAILLPYFWSVNHLKLQDKFGKEKGTRIGDVLGMISGWGFFIFWIGIWITPQERFTIPVLEDLAFTVPVLDISVPMTHFLVFIPCFVVGMWYGIKGVIEVSLKVAETHRPEKVITTGVYSTMRHPQYFGGLVAHVGISFVFSAWYSLLVTPLVFIVVYVICWKEEKELLKEFGEEYEEYRKKVPRLLPRLEIF
ncbi:MAG: methyltransferase family protein [Candidatus Odinarchaeota archaeon]